MEKNIVCLMKDHTVKRINCDNLKKYCKSGDVKHVMIPVGIEEAQFIVLNPKHVLYNLSSVDIIMNLGITRVYDSIYATDSPIKKIHCDNVVEFYQIMHSFQKMSAFNIICNSDSLSNFHDKEYYSVSSFEMKVTDKHGTRKFRLTEDDKNRVPNYSTATPCMISALLLAIDDFFGVGRNYGKPSIISGDTQPTFYIDLELGLWQTDNDIKNKKKYFKILSYSDINPYEYSLPYVKSFNMKLCGSIAFVPPEDWALLKEYSSSTYQEIALFTTVSYCEMTSPDIWPYEDRIDTEIIYTDSSNFYCPSQNRYSLYTASDIMEILHIMVYIIRSMSTLKQISLNDDITKFCAEILFAVKFENGYESFNDHYSFKFNLFDDEIDDCESVYNRFFLELRKFVLNLKHLSIKSNMR